MRSIFANSHSLLQSGQTLRVFSQRCMQSRWKTWPQQPKAIDKPFSLFGEGFAWYSMLGSFSELRQMAQVSAGENTEGEEAAAASEEAHHCVSGRRPQRRQQRAHASSFLSSRRGGHAYRCKCPRTKR